MTEQFRKDVIKGLSKEHKTLSSKYFYDQVGDDLFMQIMAMPEYYLTNAEMDIFANQTDKLIAQLELDPNEYFEIVELGAGDGTKTEQLLSTLCNQGFKFKYLPVDISDNVLKLLEGRLQSKLPELQVEIQVGDYFHTLESIAKNPSRKILLFMGSNIGNQSDKAAATFLNRLDAYMKGQDKLLIGVDLIKSEKVVLPAYDDAQGLTKAFNLNILTRINNELGADFNLKQFGHRATYTQDEGIARSYLISLQDQQVSMPDESESRQCFHFSKDELIHTEISRKYSDSVLESIIASSDLAISEKITDSQELFADYILSKTA